MILYYSLLIMFFLNCHSVFAANVEPAHPDHIPSTTISTSTLNSKININTVELKELMKVKGLNRTKAKSILVYRKKHGRFNALDELKLVKGFKKINNEQLNALIAQLTL